MPQSMEIFVKSTKTRIIFGCSGLALVWLAVATQYMAVHPGRSGPQLPVMVLLSTLSCAWGGAFALTLGLWGGFPEWSHIFIPRLIREGCARRYKAHVAMQLNPASPYKWGSRAQVRWLQWGLVVLTGGLAALSSIVVDVPGVLAGIMGACVGGILAVVLSSFLKRR